MQRSESIKEIAAALPKAQAAITAAMKDATNPHFRSKYADLASVIEAVKPGLNAHGISFLQPVTFAEQGVCVETILLHTSGEWVSETLVIPVSKQDAQGVGSAISYGRRYGLQSLCGVPAEDDDGNAAAAAPAPAKPSRITPASGVWESLPVDMQTHLLDLVDRVRTEYNLKGADAAAKVWSVETEKLGADEKVAAWARFPSDERSAMKRAADPLNNGRKAA